MTEKRRSGGEPEMRGPDFRSGFTREQKAEIWRRMRVPVVTFVALMTFLSVNLAIGWLHPIDQAWIIEGPILVVMVAIVLLFSMEVIHDPPLVRFFSILGFCWVAILFAMTMNDYLTR